MKQLLEDEDHLQRVKTELSVWDVCLNLSDLSVLDFILDRFKMFGMQWEPEGFLDIACTVQYPRTPALALPEILSEAITALATQDFHVIARRRAEFFKKWSSRARELEREEAILRSSMDAEVERAVRGKRI